jgi:transcription elongation factor Elf1
MAKIRKIRLRKKFEVCPACGYTGAFHVFFEARKAPKVKMNLKCPNCRARYDLDLVVGIGKQG